MHISQRQPLQSIARFAIANQIRHIVVDGNNLLEVERAAESLIQSARSGNGPVFIEAVTYRQYGHVDWRDDIDVGVNRSSEDLKVWKNRDPITRLSDALIAQVPPIHSVISRQQSEISRDVDAAWDLAEKDPFPAANALLGTVYSENTK
jgi:pyruvate dehydrogenase E1 component alpha subunit